MDSDSDGVATQVHEAASAELEKELRVKERRSGRFKASCTLLQLEDTERRLGLAREFKDAVRSTGNVPCR